MTAAARHWSTRLANLPARPGWPRHLLALGGLGAAILLLFVNDAIDMGRIWWTSSSYGHCIFIPFLIAWMVHQRAIGLRQLAPVGWAPGLSWVALGSFCWLVGDAAGLAFMRQGGLVVMLQGAVVTCLGPAITRALLFPLFYAFFMVPVGSELEPALQLLTAKIAMTLLGFVGVPAHIEGIFITISNGYFEVAKACSGANFVIAMAAYGTLVCNVCFRSWLRRAIFLPAALIVCIIANGMRAFATIYVAHLTSVESAVGFDHIMWGWLFFALVITVVMLAAWPFFDRKPRDLFFDVEVLRNWTGRERSLSMILAAGLTIIIVAPSWSLISVRHAKISLSTPVLPHIPGWRASVYPQTFPWKPRFDRADYFVLGRYADGRGHMVDLAIATYASQREGKELIGFGRGAADPDSEWVWSSPAWAPENARGEYITAPGPVVRHVVSFYRVGNADVTGSAIDVKTDTMKARLTMGDQRAIAILISAEQRGDRSGEAGIKAFLRDLGSIDKLADDSLRAR